MQDPSTPEEIQQAAERVAEAISPTKQKKVVNSHGEFVVTFDSSGPSLLVHLVGDETTAFASITADWILKSYEAAVWRRLELPDPVVSHHFTMNDAFEHACQSLVMLCSFTSGLPDEARSKALNFFNSL